MGRSPQPDGIEGVRAAAAAYAEAVFRCDVPVLRGLFDERSNLYGLDGGSVAVMPRDAWLERVAARVPPAADAHNPHAVELADATGPDTGMARVRVLAGGLPYLDYLNFLRVDSVWRVIAKVWRAAEDAAPHGGQGASDGR